MDAERFIKKVEVMRATQKNYLQKNYRVLSLWMNIKGNG